MNSVRRVGKYTKHENAELLRMFGQGYSIYKICRNLNRSQKSIRNNLIRLGKVEGDITPRQSAGKSKAVVIEDSSSPKFWSFVSYGLILSCLTTLLVINPQYNILEVILIYIFY